MKKIFTIFAVVLIFGTDLFAQTGDIFPLKTGRKLRYAGFLRDKATDSNLAAPILKSYTILDSGMFYYVSPSLAPILRPSKATNFIIDSLRIITGATTYIDTTTVMPLKRATNYSGDIYLLSNFTSTFQKLGHVSAYPFVWVKLWKEGLVAPGTYYALDTAFTTPLGNVPVKIQATVSAAENFLTSTGATVQAYKAEFKSVAPTMAPRNTYTIWAVPKYGIVQIIVHGDGVANGQIGRLVGEVTNVPDRKEIVADRFELAQNYPNPFNPSTKIKFSLPEKSSVKVKIFDALGREISTLVNSTLEQGKYEVPFIANGIASSIYYYQISAEGLVSHKSFTQTNKMILNK